MNRILSKIEDAKRQNKKLLSPYITAGDPNLKATLGIMHALVNAGADIIEIGVPFSDPMAEGPVTQAAMERALSEGVTTDDVLNLIAEFRTTNNTTPVVLMGYANPIEYYGYEAFAKRAKECGVDGTIIVDLPPEEFLEIKPIWEQYNIYPIFLCSLTTADQRMKRINEVARGYLYLVSLKGITGANSLNESILKEIYLKRKTQIDVPLLIGFGIKTPETAKKIAQYADGIIIGAALVEAIHQAYINKEDYLAKAFNVIATMRKAID